MSRNPPWDHDERLLALDLYLRRQTASKTDPEVILFSHTLNRRGRALGIASESDFRNPAGVALKLANFAALDPSYPGTGMRRYSRGDAETWEQYSGDSDALSREVDEILKASAASSTPAASNPLLPLEDDTTAEYAVTIDRAVRTARRREANLVRRFGEYLTSQNHAVGSHRHTVENSILRVDLVDETDRRIWEAKYEVGRNAVRLAIGQLADYRRFEPANWRTGVLLSRRPSPDLVSLCASVGSAVAWPIKASPSFDLLE